MSFTQERWDELRRERAFNGLAKLLEPELEAALEAPTCKSLRARGSASPGTSASARAEIREGKQVRIVKDGHGEAWYKNGRMVGFRSPVAKR